MDKESSESFVYERRYYYPHMKPYDEEIWNRFIDAFPDVYEHVQYDVAVGTGSEFDPTVNPETGGDIYKLYQKKIDVVAFKGDQIDIIELKPKAGPSAVGQVKMYKKLYKEDFSPPVEPKCVVVTDKVSADTAAFAHSEGVQMIVV